MSAELKKTKPAGIPEATYPRWYADWMAHYLATFGKVFDESLVTSLPRWYAGFAVMRVVREELDAVTIRILSGNEPLPAFPSDHLERIKIELYNLRAERKKAEEKDRVNKLGTGPALSYSVWTEAVNRSAKAGNSVALSLLNKGN